MKRAPPLAAALLCTLLFVTPAGAQKSELPTELWSEYPLVQKVETTDQKVERTETTTAIGPLLPPGDPEAAPAVSESPSWPLWLALLAVGSIALLVAARVTVPVAHSGVRVVGGYARRLRPPSLPRPRPRARTRKPTSKPVQLREGPPHPRAPVKGAQAQYAPLPPVAVAEPDIEREPRRSVVRRTGLLRSRFVVVEDEPGGNVRRVARSRSFWRIGSVARRELATYDVWYELVNDLRATGWEPESPRSDYYVLLRRVDGGTTSILPTIGAYTLVPDDPDEA
jgi:hypothetical protein